MAEEESKSAARDGGVRKEKSEEGKAPVESNGDPLQGAAAGRENGELEVDAELLPFEIVRGDRLAPFLFKFQFKNVEYSSGRNKTLLCFLVDSQKGYLEDELQRGYLEDEHLGAHAEEAFFQQVLPEYDPSRRYQVTWYVSSSPCAACAAKLAEVLRTRPTLRLTIFSARLFMWEEPEIQQELKALAAAGCKLRVMKPVDFSYTWDTFVENEDQTFSPWEDCQENCEYYQEKLASILQ